MDATKFLDSFGGIVAVIMIFAVPIVTVSVIAGIIMSLAGKRHKERMRMIEAGLVPPNPSRPGGRYGMLVFGAIMLAFGLALLIGELTKSSGDLQGGLIFFFVGVALVGSFAWIRSKQRTEAPPEPPSSPPSRPA
jgi:hypothetical protein